MRNAALLLALLPALALTSCSDDASAPTEEGPTTFSRMIWSAGYQTSAADCVITSDGLRVVAGRFAGALHVTGSPDSMVATGGADIYLVAFKPDGSVAWKNHLGGGPGFVGVNAITRNGNNDLFFTGAFYGNVTLGGVDFVGDGFNDVLLARLDDRGNLVWAAGGVGPSSDFGNDIAMASDGSVYVCGRASSEIILAGEDLGEFGSNSAFLANINSNGVGGWTVTGYGPGSASGEGVVLCDDGTVLLCGQYSGGSLDIGGEVLPLDGASASFISRFGPVAEALGNIRTGGTGTVSIYRITQINNEPIVAGTFYGAADFDVTGPGGEITSEGDADVFMARYSEDGALVWVRTFGDADTEAAHGLSRIGNSDLVLLGVFQQYLPLGSRILLSDGGTDYFIARFDGNGNLRSSGRIGSTGNDDLANVTADGTTMIVVGRTPGEIRFPDGSRRGTTGPIDAFLYQQP